MRNPNAPFDPVECARDLLSDPRAPRRYGIKMTKPSAAQRAAEFLDGMGTVNLSSGKINLNEIAADLLREDRQRRQMERAIVAWDKIHWQGDDFEPRRVIETMKKIARRLKGKHHD